MRCFKKPALWLVILLLVGLWQVLTGKKGVSEPTGWLFLFASLVPAVWLWCRYADQADAPQQAVSIRLRLRAVIELLVFFVGQSLFGGFDVARRAFAKQAVQPDYLHFDMSLQDQTAQSLFIALLGLMPGTVTVGVVGARLRIHRLDTAMTVLPAIERLQRLLGLVFADSGYANRHQQP